MLLAVLDHLSAVEGAIGTDLRIATERYSEGSAWRLRVISEKTAAALQRLRAEAPSEGERTAPAGTLPGLAKAIISQLGPGRPDVVRRACRESRHQPDDGASLGERSARLRHPDPACRRLSAGCRVAGRRLRMGQRAHQRTAEELHRLELTIAGQLPELRVADRRIVLAATNFAIAAAPMPARTAARSPHLRHDTCHRSNQEARRPPSPGSRIAHGSFSTPGRQRPNADHGTPGGGPRAQRYLHGSFGAPAAGQGAVFPRCGVAPAMIGTRRGEPRGAGTSARRTW
jgi:hypothetical protein